MKAMILAGGVGSRLRPMTCDCPKPMVPVLGQPVMEYAIQLLKTHGILEIAATVCYLPEQIMEYFGDGSRFGVHLRYFEEKEPLGTAGGVKKAQDFLDEPFIILSGDGLTDCDLSAALAFHQQRGAMATIVLRHADQPTEYGVAVTEEDGRIRSFLEKPDWSDVLSDLVNTGIYILQPEVLQYVDEGTSADFSRDLFPKLLQEGKRVYGYAMEGYWCDIGNVESYCAAQRAFLSGEIHLQPPKQSRAMVDPRAQIGEHVYIGEGAVIGPEARIEAYSVIGEHAAIGRGACVKRAVLWKGAVVAEHAQASGCVLCDGARLEEHASAYENSVVGRGSLLGAHGALMPGVRIWPMKKTEEYVRVEQDLVWGSGSSLRFRGAHLRLSDPMQAVLVGKALAQMAPSGQILMGCDETCGGQACLRACSAGCMAMGTEVWDAGVTSVPVLRHLCRGLHVEGAAFCTERGVLPLTSWGGEYAGNRCRQMEKLCARESMPTGFRDTAAVLQQPGGTQLYAADLAARFPEREKGTMKIYAPSEPLLRLAESAFRRMHRPMLTFWEDMAEEIREDEWVCHLEERGVLTGMADSSARVEGDFLQMALLWAALEGGERSIALSDGSADAMWELAGRYGAQIDRIHSGFGEELQGLAQISPVLFRLKTDGLFAALFLQEQLEKKQWSLSHWQSRMPKGTVASGTVPVLSEEKGQVLRVFASQCPGALLGDGVHIRTKKGRVWIRPSSDQAECLVSCESEDMETAQELLGEYASRVLQAAKEKP